MEDFVLPKVIRHPKAFSSLTIRKKLFVQNVHLKGKYDGRNKESRKIDKGRKIYGGRKFCEKSLPKKANLTSKRF
jgi:hypothetical protein